MGKEEEEEDEEEEEEEEEATGRLCPAWKISPPDFT